MSRELVKYGLGWGFVLWLIGYVLGILLFIFIPVSLLGWVISPIGIVITWWVLTKKVSLKRFGDYVSLGVIWMLLAVALDYVFLVMMFAPEDGYYKLDVYLYYLVTLGLPVLFGWKKRK